MSEIFAIVETSKTSRGIEVQLLGYGHSEQKARIAAYAFTHHGHNDYDTELREGTLVTFSRDLAALYCAANQGWDDTVDEECSLVSSKANDAHHAFLSAIARLYVVGSELRFNQK